MIRLLIDSQQQFQTTKFLGPRNNPRRPNLRFRLSTQKCAKKSWHLSRVRERQEICGQDLIIFADFSGASRKEK